MPCKFCGAAPKQTWKGETIYYECGTRPHHLEPATMACWGGLVMKLKARLDALESPGNVVVRHDDVVEAVRYTGCYGRAGWWQRLRKSVHPEKILDTPKNPD